ncbi:MAG: hypothetical protein LKH27_09255 [Prevotella sp.]|jgi:hypothetical protein|nr:hypothetical protein [Prevotella sp.]MCH3985550.1 hypothetical protein [Prevotella sp.]MCH3991767.1 hypothetical protein [Prevotella sp.]MCH4017676.1 hypothetical protein [Prevotella sp.]MCH4216550.1 hypothetical protein [Prevotella sp.]MCH4251392.1 hypothetical protein [Prevotella sp.]
MMKRKLFVLFVFLMGISLSVFGHNGFNPERWQAEMEQYIVSKAGLTPFEASRFFPVYREWKEKERVYFDRLRFYRHINSNDPHACTEAIQQRDEIDLNIKKLQQLYHKKFLKMLPATKVYRIIRAEDEFHRQSFRKFIFQGGDR